MAARRSWIGTLGKAKRPSRSDTSPGYIHGYSKKEQDRLRQQARFLESSVYAEVDFSSCRDVVEIGCGVGAQTEILLERFPGIRVHGIDASAKQVAAARRHHAPAIRRGRASFEVGDALALRYPDNRFDGAFLCWFLEHVRNPVSILKEAARVLNSGGRIFCNEVLNSSLFVEPYSPATLQYWFAHNDHQWNRGGDPFVGAKLGNYLQAAGYQDIQVKVVTEHYDNRMPKRRAQAIEYWTALMLSAAPELIEQRRVTQKDVAEMTQELSRLKDDPNSVFYINFVQATARVY